MKKYLFISCFFAIIIAFFACEREVTPDIDYTERLVLEGYIEGGERSTPPYVILTRSLDFFKTIDPKEFGKYLVHDAFITVTDGTVTDTLQEICLNELTPEQRVLAGQFLGINVDSLDGINANLCIYTSLTFRLLGKEGKTYSLKATAEGKTITAVTTIPILTKIDSLVVRPVADKSIDTLRQLRGYLSDPSKISNFYRTMVSIDGGSFRARGNSVVNDRFFDGKPSFEFPIPKPSLPNQETFNFETNGLYKIGDKVSVKWMCIDQKHFTFWETSEASIQNQGPFSTYTRISGNVKGGLGNFGGAAVSFHDITITK